MLALIIAMILCVALGVGVVIYVMLEARREGRDEFWTSEGEELIAGVRRTSGRVRERGSRLSSSAVERTQALRSRLPERSAGASGVADDQSDQDRSSDRSEPPAEDLRAAS